MRNATLTLSRGAARSTNVQYRGMQQLGIASVLQPIANHMPGGFSGFDKSYIGWPPVALMGE